MRVMRWSMLALLMVFTIIMVSPHFTRNKGSGKVVIENMTQEMSVFNYEFQADQLIAIIEAPTAVYSYNTETPRYFENVRIQRTKFPRIVVSVPYNTDYTFKSTFFWRRV